jgi:hypothetical protein
MIEDSKLIDGIQVIMRECWDDLPDDLGPDELAEYARQLLKPIENGDSKRALDLYVSQTQSNMLRLAFTRAFEEVAARATKLVTDARQAA